jgi:hypothetical protein
VGASELEVRARLGPPDGVSAYDPNIQTFYYRRQGLHVRFDPRKGMRVSNLSVGAPR